ncbi:DUF6463 family protein [Colwellia psychrerythraea]|uniref:Lipoprotein n=1 Tax=Colwellia psychrerythraea TaxID=28229 RepID=A0A099KB43_COLPS|nr:DUF6463 family protein [Colwellia psychrerythraea]KGJ86823.1 hypothetical protein GAB14E_4650 [Colwellia psychrerythraea]
MKNWQGNWIIAVSACHTLFAVIMFAAEYSSLYDNGIINSLTTDRSAAAVWFFLFGQALFITGLLIKHFDSVNNSRVPLSVTLNLLLLTVIGITIMPDSGFWLMFPPLISLLMQHRNKQSQNKDKNKNQTAAV